MPAVGFSSHAPLPFPTDWTMTPELVPMYCAEIRELQAEFKDRIRVWLGLEIDYMPGLIAPHDQKFDPLKLDYRIGAVHFVGRFQDGMALDDRQPPPLGGGLSADFRR
jgi:histidinol-phosphatase (PHP family)